MLKEFNQMISVNPEAILTRYDQTRGRLSLASGRQTGVREDLLVLLLGPVCVVDGAAPSMLTHRETAVRATRAGVSGLADDSNSLNSTAKASPS